MAIQSTPHIGFAPPARSSVLVASAICVLACLIVIMAAIAVSLFPIAIAAIVTESYLYWLLVIRYSLGSFSPCSHNQLLETLIPNPQSRLSGRLALIASLQEGRQQLQSTFFDFSLMGLTPFDK